MSNPAIDVKWWEGIRSTCSAFDLLLAEMETKAEKREREIKDFLGTTGEEERELEEGDDGNDSDTQEQA